MDTTDMFLTELRTIMARHEHLRVQTEHLFVGMDGKALRVRSFEEWCRATLGIEDVRILLAMTPPQLRIA